jgi:hypothetical protein
MKRIIEKYDNQFIKNGKRISATIIHVSWKDLPDDCDLSGFDFVCMNALYKDSCIHITKFDDNQNRICIDIPLWMQQTILQGQRQMGELIREATFENECTRNDENIPYNIIT